MTYGQTLTEVIRDEIKRYPIEAAKYPPFAPTHGATEHTIAGAVTAHLAAIIADPETVEAVAEAIGTAPMDSRWSPDWTPEARAAIAVLASRIGVER